jgi:hypothetical protein
MESRGSGVGSLLIASMGRPWGCLFLPWLGGVWSLWSKRRIEFQGRALLAVCSTGWCWRTGPGAVNSRVEFWWPRARRPRASY